MTSDLSTISAQVRYDLRAGRCWVATFATTEGEVILEYRTPRGALYAERPRLVLWQQGALTRILADLDLTTADRVGLDHALSRLLTSSAGLAAADQPLYDLLLALVRAHHLGANRRTRVPTVGTTVTEEGIPSLDAWSSCLTLADLQDAALTVAA